MHRLYFMLSPIRIFRDDFIIITESMISYFLMGYKLLSYPFLVGGGSGCTSFLINFYTYLSFFIKKKQTIFPDIWLFAGDIIKNNMRQEDKSAFCAATEFITKYTAKNAAVE